MNTQAKVALDKQAHPERYCKEPRCLWKVLEPIQVFNGGAVYKPKLNCPNGRCPRHQAKVNDGVECPDHLRVGPGGIWYPR